MDYPDYQTEAEIAVVEMDSAVETQATKAVVVMESRVEKAMACPHYHTQATKAVEVVGS